MNEYIKLLQRIHDSKELSIFGHMLTFKLYRGFPILNKDMVDTNTLIKELLWFIKGDSYLKEDMPFSEKYDYIKEEDIISLVDKKYANINGGNASSDKLRQKMISDISRVILNSTGPAFPSLWRNIPFSRFLQEMPILTDDRIADDKLVKIELDYTILKGNGITKEDGSEVTFEEFKHHASYNKIDQMQNLIYGLKNHKSSINHVITSWIPENIPFNELSPIDNILLGKSGRAPRQITQQYFVSSDNNDKFKLSLKVDFLKTNALSELPYDISMFALLLNMVASVVDMVPGDLIVNLGHVYINDENSSLARISNMSHDYLYNLSLNENIKNIYNFTDKDITISK